jgi:hypothetical protein
MNIQTLIDQDPRIVDLRKQYQELIARKNQLIMDISHVEADIIKASGTYETIAQEVVKKFVPQAATTDTVEPAPVEPVVDETPEENQDDGFAEASVEDVAEPNAEIDVPEPSAENINPIVE